MLSVSLPVAWLCLGSCGVFGPTFSDILLFVNAVCVPVDPDWGPGGLCSSMFSTINVLDKDTNIVSTNNANIVFLGKSPSIRIPLTVLMCL
jgi:hypothetical protein